MTISPYVVRLREKIGRDLLYLPAATVAARGDDGRYLVMRHVETGLWNFPGGMIEPAEDPARAALREFREETGLDAEILRLVGVYGGEDCTITYRNGDVTNYMIAFYEAAVTGGALTPDPAEALEMAWMTPGEIGALGAMPPWLRRVLPDVF